MWIVVVNIVDNHVHVNQLLKKGFFKYKHRFDS